MVIHTETAPPFHKNGFLVGCEETQEAIVIDPGDEVEAIITRAGRLGFRVRHILLTHAHLDHVTGVARAKAAFDAPVYLHEADEPLYRGVVEQGLMFGMQVEAPPPVDHHYTQGSVVGFGRCEVRVHHTPGHCPGGVCLQVGREGEVGRDLFVGDTLFAGSIGRTDLPGGDHRTLLRSIQQVLFAFDDNSRVYPGHGDPTTIGRERKTNPFLQGLDDFS